MAKLPESFVKSPTTSKKTLASKKSVAPKKVVAPAANAKAAPSDAAEPTAAPKKRAAKKKRKSLLRDPAELAREVLLRLTVEEHQALETARAELGISLEDMLHGVLGEWLARRTQPEPEVLSPIEEITLRLRRFARAPLQSWRELGASLRRAATARLIG